MKYPEEDIAREFHRELVRRFGALSPTIAGAGVHWHCTVGRDDRECRIHCLTLRNAREYFTSFRQGSEAIAYSRIPSSDDTLRAVADWLNDVDLPEMYDRHRFIDARKRRLEQIRDAVIGAEPDLHGLLEIEFRQNAGDIYTLFFRGNGRSCEVSFYGKNQWPDAKFSWDRCQLFQYQPQDNAQFASVLTCWIGNAAMPSEMRSKFPWLTIGELADDYEAGKPIEGEFINSWDRMEAFYDDPRFRFAEDVKAFLRAMRSKGYHKTLRAGQSLWSLVLSRSRRHGMRKEQPYIQFWFHDGGMAVVSCIQNRRHTTKTVFPKIEYTLEIEDLLNQLEAAPIE